jgi:hypothetical protein
MNSKTTNRFWKCYSELPDEIKKHAKEAYKLFIVDPYYPSLQFKRVHSYRPIFSVRITKDYRAIGLLEKSVVIWFWIGSHSKYSKLLNQFRNT